MQRVRDYSKQVNELNGQPRRKEQIFRKVQLSKTESSRNKKCEETNYRYQTQNTD